MGCLSVVPQPEVFRRLLKQLKIKFDFITADVVMIPVVYDGTLDIERPEILFNLSQVQAFAVDDAAGECVEYSTISGKSSAVLSAQGRFVLVGGLGIPSSCSISMALSTASAV